MAALFALAAMIAAIRSPQRYLRVYFWLLAAAIGLLMMMGGHTPLYRLLYHIPVINLFRHPWRHAFEWTLGVSMLAAFGWDMAARLFISARAEGGLKASWRLPGNFRVDIS